MIQITSLAIYPYDTGIENSKTCTSLVCNCCPNIFRDGITSKQFTRKRSVRFIELTSMFQLNGHFCNFLSPQYFCWNVAANLFFLQSEISKPNLFWIIFREGSLALCCCDCCGCCSCCGCCCCGGGCGEIERHSALEAELVFSAVTTWLYWKELSSLDIPFEK